MDAEKLHEAVVNNDCWGSRQSEKDNFYRLIYKLDKKKEKEEKLTIDEVNWLLGSYKKWFFQCEELLADCNDDNAGNREAQAYGNQLKVDVLNHIHTIITESDCEDADIVNKLRVKGDMAMQAKAISAKPMEP